eukprot:403355648
MESTQQTSKLTLYGDFVSQPFRAVLIFLKMNKILHELHLFKLMKGEHFNEEFTQISPQNKVPAIVDVLPNGETVKLFESHAIIKYLKSSRQCAAHWYPESDPKLKAKMDEYLDWHHLGVRGTAIKYLILRFRDLSNDQAQLNGAMSEFKKSLKLIENYWLSSPEKQFLLGNEISIADLTAFCELAQLLPIKEDIFKDCPRIKAWLHRIMSIPEVKEVHQDIQVSQKRAYERLDKQREQNANNTPKL